MTISILLTCPSHLQMAHHYQTISHQCALSDEKPIEEIRIVKKSQCEICQGFTVKFA